ncbi:MAG: hypothetical protein OEV43_09950 [Coriobacteriia bacterium]|nr:hypothetical protein [Coriobacteriia bacterium]
MDEKTKRVLTYVGIAIAAAIIGALIVWGFTRTDEPTTASSSTDEEKIASLEAEVESLTAQVTSLEADLADTERQLEDALARADSGSTGGTSGGSTGGGTSGGTSGGSTSSGSETQFCYITKVVWEGATPQITVDYAQLLTGQAAHDAAVAAGEEPLDFFIKNENPKLRTFPADSSKSVKLVSKADGVDPGGYNVNFGQWVDYYSGMSGGLEHIADSAYYITITDGKIVKIEEVYFP